jgi:hypothetical protein
MIKVWQAKEGLPNDMLPDLIGHIGGLLCLRNAQHSMHPPRTDVISLEERTGDFVFVGKIAI